MKFSEIPLPSNKKFGLFFWAVFLVLSVYFFYRDMVGASITSGTISFTLIIISLVKPVLLLPLNKLWMGLGLVLNTVASPLVLGVIFFFIFVPVGMIMKAFRRDELGLKNKKGSSLWKEIINKI